ncbi:coiled-coil domain-containing protein 183-like isoform X2 [Ornithorhynchus anatinus]|uniref:coiled-coil domain-containing protein 183-like isoform X2 n=1 Tax=Ornithorhynchus anatinus TaxID=9258 RepID=UPI0010A8F2E4|nr:coiled-coil domain-containing protein 183-like isoform X2 [Ornithorhynchus anatinus]
MALRGGTQQEEEEESEPGGAEATMKVQGGKDIRDQIQELRAIIRLQEQGRVLHTQSSKQRVNQNKDTVGLLQGSIRQRTREWQMARKHDERSISWAFREEHLLKLATNKTSMESVQQKLQKYIYDRVKVHDALVHLLRRRAAVLEDLQRELLRLRRLEEPSKETELQHQRIRQLENSIEKMEMKCSSAQSIHQMYENSLASLKQELASYPSKLSNMANMVGAYQSALQDMTQMAQETIEITEVTKLDAAKAETALIAEHEAQESQLNAQKKQVDKAWVRDTGDRHRQSRRDTDFSFLGEDLTKGKNPEPSKSQMEYEAQIISEVEKVKTAVQCSNIWDITGRFQAQKVTEEKLVQQIAECEQKRKELKALLHKLDLERTELKYHQTPSSIRYKQMEEQLKQKLEAEEARRQQASRSVEKNQELMLTVQNGIDNLFMRLCSISVPGEEDVPTDFKDTFKKLEFCQRKLVHLVSVSKDVPPEEVEKVKHVLEKLAQEDKLNRKVPFEDQDTEITETFNYADMEDYYVPTREEIKRQGKNLIEAKLKASKKKPKN